jgi:fumarate hydratase subunit alpha
MAIESALIKKITAELYEKSLKKIPEDTHAFLSQAINKESNLTAKNTLKIMVQSADLAKRTDQLICSDVGIPTYIFKIGSKVQFNGPIKQAIQDGFKELTEKINPPILKMVTNPLTHERSYEGKDIPIVSYDVIDDADYVEIICSPKAMGTGRWEAIEAFVYPTHEMIEKFVIDVVMKAGSQPCLPIVVGVGVGGTFDYAAKLAKESMLRPHGLSSSNPILADMEVRLLKAINQMDFGPMGTGGDTSAMSVNIDFAYSHGFVPVAVCINCWINRRTSAKIYNDGRVENLDW